MCCGGGEKQRHPWKLGQQVCPLGEGKWPGAAQRWKQDSLKEAKGWLECSFLVSWQDFYCFQNTCLSSQGLQEHF